MVSVREGGLWLLTLRGSVTQEGIPVDSLHLLPGVVFELCSGVRLRVRGIQVDPRLNSAGVTLQPSLRHERLDIVASYDSVQLHTRVKTIRVVGRPAQVLTQLAEFGCPVEWWRVAEALWGRDVDRTVLRRRWDRVLSLLRARLAVAGIRPNLVASDGKGLVELLRYPGDSITIESL